MVTPIAAVHLAQQVGWKDDDVVRAVAIAIASSGLNEESSERQPDGSINYGLWRISSKHQEFAGAFFTGAWKNPLINAGLAMDLYQRAGWQAFPAFRPGNNWLYARYLAAVPVAKAAALGTDVVLDPAVAVVKPPLDAAAEALGQASGEAATLANVAREGITALKWLQQPQTWVRIAQMGLGAALVIGGVMILVQGTAVAKALPLVGAAIGGKAKLAKGAPT